MASSEQQQKNRRDPIATEAFIVLDSRSMCFAQQSKLSGVAEHAHLPKTWYGMSAYAKDGIVVCFFQSAQKLKTR